jgi:biopolymer transport protein ExbB/TolQ
MDEPQQSSLSPERRVRSSSPLLAIYLGVLVIGIWLLIHVVFQLRLTELLSHAIAVTGAEWIMYLLIGLSVLSVGVTIERWLFYQKQAVDAEPLNRRLQELLRNGQVDEALTLAESLPAMEGRSVAACLRCLGQGPDAMEREMTAILAQERPRYERHLIILGTLGNNAPFIGLFGTVLGIIKAFMDLAADVAGGASVVMAGISEALVATALGLLVAIPSVVAYNALKARVRAIVANAEYLARAVIAYAEATAQSGTTTEKQNGDQRA